MTSELFEPPATRFAGEARRLLDQCPPVVVAHSERSYQFAVAFAVTDGVELDDEVLYLGTLLHDVGLSPAAAGSERFEVRGANVVRSLLVEHGMERDRIANVWDCIAMASCARCTPRVGSTPSPSCTSSTPTATSVCPSTA